MADATNYHNPPQYNCYEMHCRKTAIQTVAPSVQALAGSLLLPECQSFEVVVEAMQRIVKDTHWPSLPLCYCYPNNCVVFSVYYDIVQPPFLPAPPSLFLLVPVILLAYGSMAGTLMLSECVYVCLHACLSVCLSVYPSVCLSVLLSNIFSRSLQRR